MHPTRVWLAALGVGVACLALGTSTSTLTASATPSTPDTVAVIGDFGSGAPAEAQVARLVTNARPRAVVTVGDNVYSSGDYAAHVG